MKRSMQFLALALTLCLLVGGCSAKSNNATMPQAAPKPASYASDEMEPMEEPNVTEGSFDAGATTGALEGALASRKIIRDASLSIQTLEFDVFLEALSRSIAEAGGYVSSSYTSGNSYYRQYLRSAQIEARIPADALDAFLTGVSGLGNVTDRSISVRDVTTSYVDTEAHLQALRTEQEALLKILENAETVEDLITVQNRLSEVRYEIESYESTIRSYDDLIAMSTVTMHISEVERETAVEQETFWQEVSRRFSESLEDVGQGFQSFGAWFLGNLPAIIVWVIILGGIAVVVVAVVRRSSKRRAQRAEQRRAETAQRLRDTQAAQAALKPEQPAPAHDGTAQQGQQQPQEHQEG